MIRTSIRLSVCIILLARLGHSITIPSQAIEMANRPLWNQNIYYGNSETRYSFEGVLKDGSAIRFTSSLYGDSAGEYVLPDTARSFIRIGFGDKPEIPRRHTSDFDSLIGLEIKGSREGIDTLRHRATVFEGDWLFPSITGKISLYSHGPGGEDYAYMEIPGRGIEKYEDSTLLKELRTDKASAGILQKERTFKATAGLLLIGGGIMLVGGILSSDETKTDEFGHTQHEFNASPLIAIGLGFMAGSIVPYSMSGGQFERAVRAYNGR